MVEHIQVGMRLSAAWSDGAFYPAEVISISTSKKHSGAPVKVRFCGYGSGEDTWVAVDSLHSKVLKKAQAPETEKANAIDMSIFKKGREVQVKSPEGFWSSARVVTTKFPDSVKVQKPGYSAQWVPANCVQVYSEKVKAPIVQQLIRAACDDEYGKLDKLLAEGHSPSWSNDFGQTALHIAAMWGNWQSVRVLLCYRADVNAWNCEELGGNTPLHMLSKSDMSESFDDKDITASVLIQASADIHAINNDGLSPINLVCSAKFREVLADAVEEKLYLHRAVRRMEMKDLERILQRISLGELQHSQLSALNCSEQTPLHVAAHSGNFRIVKMLIEAAADINAYEPDQDNDYSYTTRNFQRDSKKHATALHICSAGGNVLMMQMLLDAKADVNARDSFECTPLHNCLFNSQDADFGLCVGVHVKSNKENDELNGKIGAIIGQVLPTRPACSGCSDPTCTLESEYASAEVEYRVLVDGGSPQGILLKEGCLSSMFQEAIDVLLEARADVNVGNNRLGIDRSVLHTAAHEGNITLARKVIASRANVDMQMASSGLTPLHLAIRGRRHDLVHLLLESSADVDLIAGGKTATQLAAVNGLHLDVAGLTKMERPSASSVGHLSESVKAALHLM